MKLDHVMSRSFAPVEQSYDWRGAALYALSLGSQAPNEPRDPVGAAA
jgi:hypothetical protein